MSNRISGNLQSDARNWAASTEILLACGCDRCGARMWNFSEDGMQKSPRGKLMVDVSGKRFPLCFKCIETKVSE